MEEFRSIAREDFTEAEVVEINEENIGNDEGEVKKEEKKKSNSNKKRKRKKNKEEGN